MLRLHRRILLATLSALVGCTGLRADYADLITFFETLAGSGNAAVFPVGPGSLDDVESAFGPREQSSTGNYDWHRGIDIDGEDMVDAVVAPLDGYFYDYRTTTSGGNIVILEHRFTDFGTPSITYAGQTLTKFYTWHLHLWDDEVAANGTSTDDLVSGYTAGDAISRGTPIGVLSNSGSSGGSPYAPHLHFELRVGTNSSLEYQLNNDTTQWGFDPHMNPMLLFGDPGNLTQSLSLASGGPGSTDLVFDYSVSNDDYPLLNSMTAQIRNASTLAEIDSHTLEYNQRTGFDAASTALLDTQDTTLPYVEPSSSPFSSSDWETQFVVPDSWLEGNIDQGYELLLTATDIWGNSTTTTLALTAVPEPRTTVLLLGLSTLLVIGHRRISPKA